VAPLWFSLSSSYLTEASLCTLLAARRRASCNLGVMGLIGMGQGGVDMDRSVGIEVSRKLSGPKSVGT